MEGRTVPSILLRTRVRDESVGGTNPFRWQDVRSEDLFKGRRVVVLSLPGAFTPTCSTTHLPGYERNYDEIRGLGIDEIYCFSVNDAFVMFRWGKSLEVSKVKLIPDGNGDFTRQMGMLVDKRNLGFGLRSWRYSMVVNDGVIEKMFAEPGLMDECPTDPFEVSDCDTMLAYLRENRK